MNTQSELTTLRAQLAASEVSRKELREAGRAWLEYMEAPRAFTQAYEDQLLADLGAAIAKATGEQS